MATIRQIEANRQNALKSTGPKTIIGKQHSSQNAVRHGLTCETVVMPFEEKEDYKAFELAITADYGGESAVDRELIFRLASLLWRLRGATSIETSLFKINWDLKEGADPNNDGGCDQLSQIHAFQNQNGSAVDLAFRFIQLVKLDDSIFERLGRYEATLWRQVRQILYTLDRHRTRRPSRYTERRPYPWDREE